MAKDYDVAVVGGGLLGFRDCLGLGPARQARGACSTEATSQARLAGNFALVWVQSKGPGMPAYTGWTGAGIGSLGPARRRAEGADRARRRLQQNGGFHLTLGDDEFGSAATSITRMHNQTGAADYRMEMLSASSSKKMLPLIGPEVSGGSFFRSTAM